MDDLYVELVLTVALPNGPSYIEEALANLFKSIQIHSNTRLCISFIIALIAWVDSLVRPIANDTGVRTYSNKYHCGNFESLLA